MKSNLMNRSRTGGRLLYRAAALISALLLGVSVLIAHNAAAQDEKFDHFSTGFPLTGGHRDVACSDCHMRGMFKGTPRQCAACHTSTGLSSASKKPVTHINTTDFCEDCHTTSAWRPTLKVDHFSVIGSCASCHNGRTAQGKAKNHISSDNN